MRRGQLTKREVMVKDTMIKSLDIKLLRDNLKTNLSQVMKFTSKDQAADTEATESKAAETMTMIEQVDMRAREEGLTGKIGKSEKVDTERSGKRTTSEKMPKKKKRRTLMTQRSQRLLRMKGKNTKRNTLTERDSMIRNLSGSTTRTKNKKMRRRSLLV